MNKLLPKVLLPLLLAGSFLPVESFGQCTCTGGVTPNKIEHLVVLPPTSNSNTTINFPKFNPATGTLNCVTLNDTLSIVSATGIRNYDPGPVEYEFQLTVNTKVEGPSLSRTNFKNEFYGPDILGGYGSPTDSINYGPDTLYNKWPSVKTNNSDMTPYLGATGNVSFVYTIGGGVVAAGGANYNAQVRTTTWGVFKLTYLWCNNTVLAQGIKNFTVVKHGELVDLEWQAPESSVNNIFEIEISYDGNNFSNLVKGGQLNPVEGSSTKYQYQYRPDQTAYSKIYYRIKYYDGKSPRYSQLKTVNAASDYHQQLSIYPNPVIKSINLEFGEAVTGEFDVELTNQVGQSVFKKRVMMRDNRSMSVLVNTPPPTGIYFLKARQAGSSKVYSGKLLFRR